MSGLTFHHALRITKRPQYEQCYLRGRRYFSPRFIIYVFDRQDLAPARLGMAVSKKIGIAVRRNRVKRLVREVFRHHQAEAPTGLDIVFVAKRSIQVRKLNYLQVKTDWAILIKKIKADALDKANETDK